MYDPQLPRSHPPFPLHPVSPASPTLISTYPPTHSPVRPTFFRHTVHLFLFGVFCFSSNEGGSGPVTSVIPVASLCDTSSKVAAERGKQGHWHGRTGRPITAVAQHAWTIGKTVFILPTSRRNWANKRACVNVSTFYYDIIHCIHNYYILYKQCNYVRTYICNNYCSSNKQQLSERTAQFVL